ncbi:MAG: hypothetical protein HY049_04170 [Acidobacteria bacterium]|nr:hypothetical protein [Acidobacteriota bacterium]
MRPASTPARRAGTPVRAAIPLAVALSMVTLLSSGRVEASPPDPASGTISFGEIRAGMKGYGRTVFLGTKIESFDVEVIGTLTNIAPKKNLILARLSGGPLAITGVLEGMSGSPVYLDGRLAGAVAYAWGFAKEPICGVTPIDEMIDVMSRAASADSASAAWPRIGDPGSTALLTEPGRASAFLRERITRLVASGGPGLTPMRLPLVFGGAARSGAAGAEMDAFRRAFQSLGLSPVVAGGAGGDSGRRDDAPFEPGSALGVQIVRGDVETAAIGTVTFVRGDEIVAFGHPFFNLGPTALPMTRAYVHGYFPSLENSFKLASATGPAGMITQDRFPGIAGNVTAQAAMVPVTLHVSSGKGREETYRFEIAADPLITPIFLHMSVLEILSASEKDVGDVTVSLRKGSKIRLEGGLKVDIENLYSGDESEVMASATVAYMTYLLMNNPDRPSHVEGIDLDVAYADDRRLARIDRVWCDRYSAAPGETIPLHVSLVPYRGEPVTVTIPLEIPKEAPEGRALLQVGDALTLSRMEYQAGGASFQPASLEQLVFLLNRIRTNNTIYATLVRPDNGAFVAGERLPNLPPSIASVLVPPELEGSGSGRLRLRGILEQERSTDFALRGYQKTMIEIRR